MKKKIVFGMISIVTVSLLGACKIGDTNGQLTNNNHTKSSSPIVSSASKNSSSTIENIKDSSKNDKDKEVVSSASESNSSIIYDLINQEFEVSLDDAIQLVLDEHPDVVITSIEFNKNLGAYGYEIEAVDDVKEFELFIDANTKEIKKQKEELLDFEDRNGIAKKNDVLLLDNIISPEQAMEIAYSEVNKKGEVTEWELSKKNHNVYYEVIIKNNSNETEVKIDSVNGYILQTKQGD